VLDRLPGVFTIAVKQAILAFTASAWVTVDPNPRAQALMNTPRARTHYYAAVPLDYGTARARLSFHRVHAPEHVTYLHRVAGKEPSRNMIALSDDPGALHTGNSAWGALGLAYLLRPRKIGILGVDGTRDEHGIGVGRPNGSLDHLPWLFETALPQLKEHNIEVRNGSPRSLVTCFPRCTPQELLSWLME